MFHPKSMAQQPKWMADFTNNQFYVFAGMNLSKQNIQTGNYVSNFNYDLADYNKDAFKPGYFAGLRMDGNFQKKHFYAFVISLNKLSTGTHYTKAESLAPFLGAYSKFKAEDQFFTIDLTALYKKLILIGDTSKHKFYFVAGPSMSTRLSGQSEDNLVNNNYRRFILKGDIGLEFDNQSYYTLFVHYKHGFSSFTNAPIKTNFNSVELGLMLKASDLF